MTTEYISTKQAAEITGYDQRKVQFMIKRGEIPGVTRIGARMWAIPRAWAEAEAARPKEPTVAEIAEAEGITRAAVYQRRYTKLKKQLKKGK